MRSHLISLKCTSLANSTIFAEGMNVSVVWCWRLLWTTYQIHRYVNIIKDHSPYIYIQYFCGRVDNIVDFLSTVQTYETLGLSRIEGIETYNNRFGVLVMNIKKRPYDPLDHRKKDFDVDYEDFKSQVKDFEVYLKILTATLTSEVSVITRTSYRASWTSTSTMPRAL